MVESHSLCLHLQRWLAFQVFLNARRRIDGAVVSGQELFLSVVIVANYQES